MKLLFIHGWPGVGKLTVARELARLTGYKVFHNHLTVDLLLSVFEFGSAPFVELREQIWIGVFKRAAESRLPGLIFTFVFEKTVRQSFAEDAVDAVEANGGEVLFVELRCRRDELERRLVNPSRQQFGKIQSVSELKSLEAKGVIQTPTLPRPNLVIDNSELSSSETARLIAGRFKL
ncbi:MAG TPA: AAA family ATPase [Blastocatellia bacterium]|nr:AAA family ATPase [Blastocatellia bacterium]